MSIARQRLGKHIPEVTFSTIEGNQLLGNGSISTHSLTEDCVFGGVTAEKIYVGIVRRIGGV
jgi:hypothetical protein